MELCKTCWNRYHCKEEYEHECMNQNYCHYSPESKNKEDKLIPPCKYNINEFCANAESPSRADYCPVPNTPDICKWEDRTTNSIRLSQIAKVIQPDKAYNGSDVLTALTSIAVGKSIEYIPTINTVIKQGECDDCFKNNTKSNIGETDER